MKDNVLLEQPLWKLFLKFVLPSVLSMIIVGVQGIVDGLFLGRFESLNAMSSVNIANPYMQLIVGCSFLICTGMLSRMGRMIGEKNGAEAKNSFKTGLVGIIVYAVIIFLLGAVFYSPLARLLGANEVLCTDTSKYIFTLSFFAPFICLMLLCGFSCRLIEKPHLYLIATVCCLMANLLLDLLMVKILKMGVVGAAIATGVSYTVGLLIVCVPFFRRKTVVNFFDGKVKFYALKEIIFNGSSEGVTYIAVAISMFLFNRSFMNFAAEKGVAAFTAINYLGNFEGLIVVGVADGIGSIVSCNYGAGQYKRVKQSLLWATVINSVIGVVLYIVVFFGGKNLVSVFIKNNNEVLQMAVAGAKLYGIAFLINGFNVIQSGYHTSLGHSLASVVIAASRGIVFIVIGIFTLPLLLGFNGVWLTLPFGELITVFVCIVIKTIYKKSEE